MSRDSSKANKECVGTSSGSRLYCNLQCVRAVSLLIVFSIFYAIYNPREKEIMINVLFVEDKRNEDEVSHNHNMLALAEFKTIRSF